MTTKSEQKNIYFIIIALLIPLILLSIVELSLRQTDLYKKSHLFYSIPETDKLLINPQFFNRYFNQFNPSVSLTPMDRNKSENTFRVFVLGGSSTAGYPYSYMLGFPSHLELNLKKYVPDTRFEVINLGITATNSFTARDIYQRLAQYDPDVVLIYMGHNEFYGALGSANSENILTQSTIRRLHLYMYDLAIYQHLGNLFKFFKGNKNSDPIRTTTMQRVIRDRDIDIQSHTFKSTLSDFESNLRSLIIQNRKSGTPIYLGTVISNLKDQPPFDRKYDSVESYESGNLSYADGDFSMARTNYEVAKDLDRVRFRAPSQINDIIRKLPDQNFVHLTDIENNYHKICDSGIEDDSCFTDHLHPNINGYQFIAEMFFTELLGVFNLQITSERSFVRVQPDVFESSLSKFNIELLKSAYPFVEESEESEVSFQSLLTTLQASPNLFDRTVADFLQTGGNPANFYRMYIISEEFKSLEISEKLKFYFSWFGWEPLNFDILQQGIQLGLKENAPLNAMEPLLIVAANRSDLTVYYNILGALYLQEMQYTHALRFLNIVEKRIPDDSDMLYNLARLHHELGNNNLSLSYLNRYEASVK
jgi:lysophospholipase L1-like esterase